MLDERRGRVKESISDIYQFSKVRVSSGLNLFLSQYHTQTYETILYWSLNLDLPELAIRLGTEEKSTVVTSGLFLHRTGFNVSILDFLNRLFILIFE